MVSWSARTRSRAPVVSLMVRRRRRWRWRRQRLRHDEFHYRVDVADGCLAMAAPDELVDTNFITHFRIALLDGFDRLGRAITLLLF